MANLEGLSARGKLAFILAEIAVGKDDEGEEDEDNAP